MNVQKLMGWLNPQDLIRLALRFGPSRDFIVYENERLNRRQVLARVEALAAGLQALGLQKGDRVATLLPACPEAVYAFLLSTFLGTVQVPLNPLLGEHELRHVLADSGAKVVITTQIWYGQRYPEILARLLPDLPDLRYIIVRDASEGDGRTFLPLAAVLASGKSLRPVAIRADDPVTLTYTSGTTGVAKGVVHTRRQSWGMSVRGADVRMNIAALRCMLLAFPPYQTAGRIGIFISLLSGGTLILMDRLDPQRMLEYIQSERVTQIGGSPTMFRLLLGAPGQERYDLSSVRRIAFSSETLSADLTQALYARFKCGLENIYGATECLMVSMTGFEDSPQQVAETVGKPVQGVHLRIVDNDRQPLPVGQRGEIAVQSSQMMVGYYRDPELTAQVLDEHGWFYTGDIGYLGQDGYLRLIDRKKDMIIRGGQNIYPTEIEHYLERHPAIRRAAVVGVAEGIGGESVWAYVECQPGATLSVTDVLNFCRGQIAPFKIPARVIFVQHMPVTASGKVQKFKLREMAAHEGSNSSAAAPDGATEARDESA